MDATRLEDLSLLFKALADPARLRILGLLAERAHAGHELADRLALTPPTISHHMRRLVAARHPGGRRLAAAKHQVKMTKPGHRPITLPQHKGRDYQPGLASAILKQAGLQ